MQKQISKKVFSKETSPSLSDVTTSLYRLFLARHSWLDSNWSLIGFFNNSLLIFWKLSDLQLFLESEKTSNYSRPQIFKEYVKNNLLEDWKYFRRYFGLISLGL